MPDHVNMDASSALENSETEQSLPPRQTTLLQESDLTVEDCEMGQSLPPSQIALLQDHELGSISLPSEATDEKDGICTQNLNNGGTETSAVEHELNDMEQLRPLHEDPIKNSSCEQLGLQLQVKDAKVESNLEQLGVLTEDAVGKYSSAEHTTSEINHELILDSVNGDALVEVGEVVSEHVQNGPAVTGTVEFNHLGFEQSGLCSEDVTKDFSGEQVKPPQEDEINSSMEQVGLPRGDAAVDFLPEQVELLSENPSKNSIKQLEPSPEGAANNGSKFEGRDRRTSTKSTKAKHALSSSLGSSRILRSRVQEKNKDPEPLDNLPVQGSGSNGEKMRKKRKKKHMKNIPVDEFSRTRKHLRYLLKRINYEQNLIDAYSGEGWKGLSLEKIKPEKELQRAKSEIFRCKLKIRDLFQRVDDSIAEGKLPESLFDSDGEIDSEDIFCAKCGSKELLADNDIILCDGACERAFHQLCLDPPLRKEDIPPDDEGWLCPGCDCKVDCVDLLNDSQGTNLCVLDNWEKIFPEAAAAAAAAAGNQIDDILGLPSDDSEDNEYDPDGSELDEKDEADESSSNDSDLYSASEESGPSLKDKQKLELPSDDSEDDEYDPNAPDLDEQGKQESSTSDFASDSEDFIVASDGNRSLNKGDHVSDEPVAASSDNSDHTKPFRGSTGERSKVGRKKKHSLNDELFGLLESDPGQGEASQVSGKRLVEKFDYKKLYDETYGNVSSDSSDEVWRDDADAPRKRRKNNAEKVASASSGGRAPTIEGTDVTDVEHNQEENECTPKRGARKKVDADGAINSPAKLYNGSSERGSISRNTKGSTYRRLGEAATQGLLKSFKENQYPDRAAKENLALELGITALQVSKWFENARWSFRHTSRMESSLTKSVPSNSAPPQTDLSEPGPKIETEDDACNGVKRKGWGEKNSGVTMSCSLTEGTSRRRCTTPRGRKNRSQLEHLASDHILTVEEKQDCDVSKPQEVRKRGRQSKAQEVRKKGRPEKAQGVQRKGRSAKAQEARKRGRPKSRKSVA